MMSYEYMFLQNTEYAWPANLGDFYYTVRNRAELDLKYDPEYQHSHFIYDGEVIDFDPEGRWPDFNFSNFGDDYRDTARIKQGIRIYHELHD